MMPEPLSREERARMTGKLEMAKQLGQLDDVLMQMALAVALERLLGQVQPGEVEPRTLEFGPEDYAAATRDSAGVQFQMEGDDDGSFRVRVLRFTPESALTQFLSKVAEHIPMDES